MSSSQASPTGGVREHGTARQPCTKRLRKPKGWIWVHQISQALHSLDCPVLWTCRHGAWHGAGGKCCRYFYSTKCNSIALQKHPVFLHPIPVMDLFFHSPRYPAEFFSPCVFISLDNKEVLSGLAETIWKHYKPSLCAPGSSSGHRQQGLTPCVHSPPSNLPAKPASLYTEADVLLIPLLCLSHSLLFLAGFCFAFLAEQINNSNQSASEQPGWHRNPPGADMGTAPDAEEHWCGRDLTTLDCGIFHSFVWPKF